MKKNTFFKADFLARSTARKFFIRTHRYYSFSETELFIWELMAKQGKIFLYQIIKQCAEYYCIARDDISVDITEFINDLLNIGLIEYEQ